MKIAKPLLLVATPIGVAGGLHEAWRLAGGLVFLMLAMLLVVGAAIGMLVMTIRRERAEEEARERASAVEPASAGEAAPAVNVGAAQPPTRT